MIWRLYQTITRRYMAHSITCQNGHFHINKEKTEIVIFQKWAFPHQQWKYSAHDFSERGKIIIKDNQHAVWRAEAVTGKILKIFWCYNANEWASSRPHIPVTARFYKRFQKLLRKRWAKSNRSGASFTPREQWSTVKLRKLMNRETQRHAWQCLVFTISCAKWDSSTLRTKTVNSKCAKADERYHMPFCKERTGPITDYSTDAN